MHFNFSVPEDFDYVNARRMFVEPDVLDVKNLPTFKWTNPDEEGVIGFMCDQKSFSIDRVTNIKTLIHIRTVR